MKEMSLLENMKNLLSLLHTGTQPVMETKEHREELLAWVASGFSLVGH